VVDNCFCTPVLQRPLQYGVDVVMHTGTKFLDGQGRVLGGRWWDGRFHPRDGAARFEDNRPSLSPFNAWFC